MILISLFVQIILFITGIILLKKQHKIAGKVLISIPIATIHIISALILIFIATFNNSSNWLIAGILLGLFSLLCLILSFIWKLKKTIKIVFSTILAIAIAISGTTIGFQIYEDNLPVVGEPDVLSEYLPYSNKLADINTNFKITSDFPKLDGATALYPIYVSIANEIYPKDILFQKRNEEICTETMKTAILTNDSEKFILEHPECISEWNTDLVDCSKTKEAYRRIVDGEADIIFVAGPSQAQEEYAIEKGVELVYTPIGREAFVFFVNSKNKLNNITVEQIQDIYSGKTTNWNDLGIKNLGDIKAFQRAEGSGSQTALQKVMAGKNLMTPPQEDVVELMGGIIDRTADYKNYKNAIGFSFRFYSTEMVKNDKIKLLSLNGIAPTLENIENGTYPIASEFYAVTRKDSTENTKKILDWLQTDDAKKIIEKVGYTPLK